MDRWNPHLFEKEGLEKSFNVEYLAELIKRGRLISQKNVPVIYSLAHLANVSKTRYADLHEVVSRSNLSQPNYPYKNFPIRKRSGGKRWISIPFPPLMAAQSWIAQNILNSVAPHNAAHAYVPHLHSPLKSHALKHCAASWILKIDIKDFFSNISERQVYQIFKGLNYSHLLSFEMARLCTRVTPQRQGSRWRLSNDNARYGVEQYHSQYVGSLPQGSPTSPALSNLVCIALDERLEILAHENNASYSRYADDLCFSFGTSSREALYKFKREVDQVIWKFGFSENPKKTRIISPGARKIVTGLGINESEPKIPKELRDRIRMHLFYAKKFGIPAHCERKNFRSVIGFRNHLNGLIRYVKSINERQGSEFEKAFQQLPWLNYQI